MTRERVLKRIIRNYYEFHLETINFKKIINNQTFLQKNFDTMKQIVNFLCLY